MTPAEIAAFRVTGFHHLRGVMPQATIDRLCEDFTEVQFVNCPWEGPWLKPEDPAPVLYMRPSLHSRPAWTEALAQAPRLTDALAALLKGTPHLEHSMALVKPGGNGQAFPWHQDSAYYGDAQPRVIATLYLDRATPTNGPLQVIRGSHRLGPLVHTESGNKKVLPLHPDPADVVTVEAAAGDCLVFDAYLVHGSQRNTSEDLRRTVRFVYVRSA